MKAGAGLQSGGFSNNEPDHLWPLTDLSRDVDDVVRYVYIGLKMLYDEMEPNHKIRANGILTAIAEGVLQNSEDLRSSYNSEGHFVHALARTYNGRFVQSADFLFKLGIMMTDLESILNIDSDSDAD